MTARHEGEVVERDMEPNIYNCKEARDCSAKKRGSGSDIEDVDIYYAKRDNAAEEVVRRVTRYTLYLLISQGIEWG